MQYPIRKKEGNKLGIKIQMDFTRLVIKSTKVTSVLTDIDI